MKGNIVIENNLKELVRLLDLTKRQVDELNETFRMIENFKVKANIKFGKEVPEVEAQELKLNADSAVISGIVEATKELNKSLLHC